MATILGGNKALFKKKKCFGSSAQTFFFMSWLSSWLQKGIDREFYLLFSIFDENDSWYLNKNIEAFTGDPSKVDENDADFKESNKMHGMKYPISDHEIFSLIILERGAGRFYHPP